MGATAISIEFQPIEKHPRNEAECYLAVFVNGELEIADTGKFVPGEKHEEWDEVEDGVQVKIFEEQDEDRWSTNHCIIEEPTHWAPIPTHKHKGEV